MEKFTITFCRKILGDAGRNLSDQEIEAIRDTFIALSDFIIDSEVEKFRCKKYERSKQTTISGS